MGKGTAEHILTAVHTSANRYTLVSLDTRLSLVHVLVVSLQPHMDGANPLQSLGYLYPNC